MEQFDIEKQTKELKSTTVNSIKGLFPIKTKDKTLRLADIWVDDRLDPNDIQSQLKAKMQDRTWGVPVYGTFELVGRDGKVIQRKDKVRLATLPKPTPRMSYILDGSEHQISNQLRLRPAGYAVRTGPGGIKGQINLSKGYSGQIEMHVNPETGVMRTRVAQANQRLYPILNALGMSDAEMEKRWGADVLEANKRITKSDYDLAVKSFAKSVLRRQYADAENAAKDLRKFVLGTEMDPKINKRTLGKPYKNMDAEFLADMGSYILGTLKGEREPHDRNALEYKEYRKITDLIEERLSLPEFRNKITRKIQYNITGRDSIDDMIHASIIGPHIRAVFNSPEIGELHQRPDQLNPLDMWNAASRVTIMGPGGIRDLHQVTDDMRDVHPSHLGFLDPVHTPECFEASTEIFTEDGWKPISEISLNDKLACRVHGELAFYYPIRMHRSKYRGFMYGMAAEGIDYCVTPNHRVYCKPKGSKWGTELAEFVHGKPRIFQCSHVPYEGIAYLSNGTEEQPKLPYKEAIPEELFHAPVDARERVFRALLENGKVFSTASDELAVGFERLAIGLGKAASHTFVEGLHEIEIMDNTEVQVFDFNSYYTEQYDGTVYCPTVPGGLVFVRRNGSIGFWSGNSETVGVVYHLPFTVTSKDKTLYTRAINPKTNKLEKIDPAKFADSVVAFPGQFDRKTKTWKDPSKVMVLAEKNKTKTVAGKDVDYTLESAKQAFSVSSNLIPFLSTNSGGRTLVSSKMAEQAVPLKDREVPLVQSKVGGDVTFEDLMGDAFAFRAPVDGIVTKASKDSISIKDSSGKKHSMQMYDDFPLNSKSFIDSDLKVKAGDAVSKNQIVADTNFTKNGTLALGKNLVTAYVPYKGYNFEDGIVITDEAAKKLVSEHMHLETAQSSDRFDIHKRRFIANFPNSYTKTQVESIDDDGIVKKGTILQPGDPIITRLRKDEIDPENIIFSKLSRTLVRPWKDDSISWHGDNPGKVVNVARHGNKVKVFIKTEEPAQIGDKLVGRFGNKGVVSAVIPAGEAPRKKDGTPVDILLNPHGIITRINIGQVLENAASKVAEKEGKPYVTDNFSDINNTREVQKAVDKAGVSDLEELEDPVTGKSLGKVNVGKTYIMKLKKQVRSQFSARGAGPGWRYSQSTQEPVKGGEEGSKSMDLLTFYSMIGHGARNNLREMASYKATRNDDFWNMLKTGSLLPAPKPTFAYNKFISYLKGAGVDVKQEGSKITLAPMTDKEIDNLSNGEIKELQFLRAKDLKEAEGGLMDKKITGGIGGTKWAHIKLTEPIVNPVFEKPVRHLLNMNNRTYTGISEGKIFVDKEGNLNENADGVTGGLAFEQLLSGVDKNQKLEEFRELAKTGRSPSTLNKANYGIRYIEALNKFKLDPKDAYILKKIPVLPPVFRPIYALPDGNLHTSSVNYLYRDLGLANQKLAFMNSLNYMPEDAKEELRRDIYQGTAAIQGLANPITFYPPTRPVKGIIEEIKGVKGAGSKTGFFQKHVLRREQDLVGRGAVIPEPKLGVDEVGLPEEMAWTIFEPFVMRDLVNQGYRATDAESQIKERSLIARKALEVAMNERPVLLNRSPSLHKFSIMALNPKITAGRAVKIPNLVVKGYNADFDGNCVISLTKLTLTLEHKAGKMSPHEIEEEIKMKFGKSSRVIGVNENHVMFESEIGDFPHIKENPKIDKNGAKIYSVEKGISVLSIDKETWEPSFEEITGFTIDKQHNVLDVETARGYKVSASDNESLCVYNHETGDIEKRKPSESIGMFCPVVKRIPITGKKYDYEIGWMIGAFVSDGFFMGDRRNTIGYSKKSTETRDRFANALSKFEGGPIGRKTYKDFHDATKDIQGESIKDHLTVDRSMEVFESCYHPSVQSRNVKTERASLYKKLPNLSEFSQDALFGILSGLLDGDGSLSWTNAKKKPQFLVSIGTSSPYLVESVKSLCKLLGIRNSTSSYGPKKGRLQKHTAYVVSLSIVDIYRASKNLILTGENKKRLEEFKKTEVSRDDRDTVPVPFQIMQRFASRIHPAFSKDKKLINSLISIKSSRKPPYVSRPMAKRMLPYLDEDIDVDKRWKKMVQEEETMWDIIKAVDNERAEDVYDLIVPSSKVFAVNDGLVVYDTMHIHVPIMPKAVNEARGMVPSRHLFNPGTGNIMISPTQESAIGLYLLTKDGKNVNKQYKTVDALKTALEEKEIQISDMVTLAGKRTSAGRALVDAVLPKKYQGRNKVLDKKEINALLKEIADNDPGEYAKTVHQLGELGNEYSYQRGFTVSLSDLQPELPEKDALFEDARKKAKTLKDEEVINLYNEVDKKAKKIIEKRLGEQENNLYQMVRSGARGNINQLKQIVSAPLLFEDVSGEPLAIPVDDSYSKGLTMGQYWNSMYGARRGSVDTKLQTAKPGEFNKDLMATVVKNVIAEEDCGTKEGIGFGIDDVDAQDRILAKDVIAGGVPIAKSGDIITSNMMSKFRSHKIKDVEARSPLTCKLPKGTCAKCYGLDADGRLHSIGDNIGAIAGQSMTEPLTQMVLRSRHHGGVAGGQQLTGYEKIDKLVRMPGTIMGKATLAERDGKVLGIEDAPAGGKNVLIEGQKHFVSPGNSLKVRVGASIKKGDPLSDGIIHPKDLVRLKGMRPAQNYLVDELTGAYKDTGVNLKRKNVEAVVRSLANTTRVLDGGDSTWLYGDVAPYTVVEDFNRSAIGKVPLSEAKGKPLFKDHGPVKAGTKIGKRVTKVLEGLGYNEVSVGPDPIMHEPFLDGVKKLPLLSKDWMAQMGYGHIVKGIREGAGQAWETDIHNYSPVPAFAYGAEFGMGPKGKY